MTKQPTATIQIRLKSDPFMDDPPGAEAYYIALGRVIVLWGRLESHFGDILTMICAAPVARHLNLITMPISIKQRAKLLRRLVNQIHALAPIKKSVLDLIPDVKDAAQDRHVIVHGHWNGFIRKDDPNICKFISQKHKDGKIMISTYNVSIEKLDAMAAKFDDLNTRLLPISFAMTQLYPLSDTRKSRELKA
jgi:hypothetical protein